LRRRGDERRRAGGAAAAAGAAAGGMDATLAEAVARATRRASTDRGAVAPLAEAKACKKAACPAVVRALEDRDGGPRSNSVRRVLLKVGALLLLLLLRAAARPATVSKTEAADRS